MSTNSGSIALGRSKDEIFDDFVLDLFQNKVDNSVLKRQMKLLKSDDTERPLPLDQTLMISTAKKQSMQILLNNLSASSDSGAQGLLSIDQLRNAAARLGGDISSFYNNTSDLNLLLN